MTDVLNTEEDYSCVDTNGNRLDDVVQNKQVQRLLPDDYDFIGVDSRGIFVFGSTDECSVYYIKFSIDGSLQYFAEKGMFGCDMVQHVKTIARRYNKWRFLDDALENKLR